MPRGTYGSADFHQILKTIQVKLDRLYAASDAATAGKLRADLDNYLDNEKTAAAVRAAKTKANRLARERKAKQEDSRV